MLCYVLTRQFELKKIREFLIDEQGVPEQEQGAAGG
jgi:hypothetical protein